MTMNGSKSVEIRKNFELLSDLALSLNAASDELTKTVAPLDEALKRLNIGITVWVTFRDGSSGEGDYDDEQVGYAKVQGKWGLSLRHISGWYHDERSFTEDGPWLFNDAPRDMRVRCVDSIPDLLAELAKQARKTTERLRERTGELREFTAGIAAQPARFPRLAAPADAGTSKGVK